MFVVAALALNVNLTRQKDSLGWVDHTNQVLRNIFAVESRILEAESAERGYLLTGKVISTDTIIRKPTFPSRSRRCMHPNAAS
jgi:CHASE3 domain sensor protein